MEQPLQIDTAAVRGMGARWRGLAAELASTAHPAPGLSCQASAAAVTAAHGDITVAATTLQQRVHASAAKLDTADARYLANEVRAADEFRRLYPSATGP